MPNASDDLVIDDFNPGTGTGTQVFALNVNDADGLRVDYVTGALGNEVNYEVGAEVSAISSGHYYGATNNPVLAVADLSGNVGEINLDETGTGVEVATIAPSPVRSLATSNAYTDGVENMDDGYDDLAIALGTNGNLHAGFFYWVPGGGVYADDNTVFGEAPTAVVAWNGPNADPRMAAVNDDGVAADYDVSSGGMPSVDTEWSVIPGPLAMVGVNNDDDFATDETIAVGLTVGASR